MIKFKNIKAVIFDMDGVITNTMPDHYRAWNISMQGENFHITHADVYGHEGQPGLNFLQDMYADRNMPYDKKRVEAILKKKELVFKRIVKTRYITGARSFVKKLSKKGILLALVTGTARHELHKILPSNLYSLFNVIVTGSDVKKGKPDPEPYLVSLKKLKIKAREGIVIENAPFGIRSAKAAGLKCLALETSLSKKFLKDADHIFPSFKSLIKKQVYFQETRQKDMKKLEINNVLILYKTSVYKYSLSKKHSLESISFDSKYLARVKETHTNHYESLKKVELFLKEKGIKYKKAKRGQSVDFSQHKFVISVGGDGTLLEAARHINDQLLLGVNSDPKWSIGRLCSTDSKNFRHVFNCILHNKFKVQKLNRLKLEIKDRAQSFNVLNDILVCHKNPAAMSRYVITLNRTKEEQKSSGVWVATASGSTGAIHSAAGDPLPISSKKYLYKPRELYVGKMPKYKLKGGIISPTESINFTSLMKDGVIYIDGCHKKQAFSLGTEATLSCSKEPLNVIRI